MGFTKMYTSTQTVEISYNPFRVRRAFWTGNGSPAPVSNFDLSLANELFNPDYELTRPIGAHVYVIKGIDGQYAGAHKIGHTTQNVHKRISPQGGIYKTRISRVLAIPLCSYIAARALETTLHKYFASKALGHEWFELGEADMNLIRTIPRWYSIE